MGIGSQQITASSQYIMLKATDLGTKNLVVLLYYLDMKANKEFNKIV